MVEITLQLDDKFYDSIVKVAEYSCVTPEQILKELLLNELARFQARVHPSSEVQQMLDRTRGMWADVEGLEEALNEARQLWDQEWEANLPSL
jgi:hypothetical protein